jgi:Cu(I)/Ag(I) efflux system membrane fusion protein
MNRSVQTIAAVFALGLAITLGYTIGQRRADVATPDSTTEAAAPTEREVLYWYDPMVPDQHFDAPGKSPFMDMMLVARYADEGGDAAAVRVDPGLQQNLGVRTAIVELDTVGAEVRVPGTLQWDLRAEQRITARVEGLVERVHTRAPFAPVRRGEPLATLLAPALSSALAEYRALMVGESPATRALQAAARSRLRVLGLTDADIGAASRDGVPRVVLRAPADGVLAEIAVREGETVMAGQLLFRLNAPDPIWLEARVPQAEIGALQPGATAQILVSAMSGEEFTGTVDAVLPQVDPATRTQSVRLVLPNPRRMLAAGMFADALLRGAEDRRRCPWVPSEALILTGREARVIVKGTDGRFRPVRVRTGRQVGERTEILDGLIGGETVVVSGQFLIDSEASLSGVLSRLDEAPADEPETETDTPPHDGDASQAEESARTVLYWYDPMVPEKHFDRPGKSPYMDMQLVPKYADEDEAADETTQGESQ